MKKDELKEDIKNMLGMLYSGLFQTYVKWILLATVMTFGGILCYF